MIRRILCLSVLTCALSAAMAQTPLPPINAETEAVFGRLTSHPGVRQALEFLRSDDARTLKDQIELTEIPAPPFKEAVRAQDYLRRLKELGFADARMDAEGNVMALRRGTGNGPLLVLAAHLDTVFPEGTDVKVKVKGNRYEAPGIYDDGRGLAALLSVVRALNQTGLKTVGDVLLLRHEDMELLTLCNGTSAIGPGPSGLETLAAPDVVAAWRVG